MKIRFTIDEIDNKERENLEVEITFLEKMGVEHYLNQFQIEVISDQESITIPVRLNIGYSNEIYYLCNCGEMIRSFFYQNTEEEFSNACKNAVLYIMRHWKDHCKARKSTQQAIIECEDEGHSLIARVIAEEFAKLREVLSRK